MIDYSSFECDRGFFYQCGLDGFIGCCDLDNEYAPNANCSFGCLDGDLVPAYFFSEEYGTLSTYTPGYCDDGYAWNICLSSSHDLSFFGCYTNGSDPCDSLSPDQLGNATSSEDWASIVPSPAPAPASFSVISLSTPLPSSITIITLKSTPIIPSTSHISSALIPTPNPAAPTAAQLSTAVKTSTGAIAGGSIGAIAAVAALAGLGLLLYCRRNNRSAVEKGPSEQTAIGGTKDETSNKTSLKEDSTTPAPVPAYSPTDPNAPSKNLAPHTLPVSEISSSDIPRPVSEMASFDPADFPVRAVSGNLSGTGFIPYAPGRGSALGSHSAKSSVVSLLGKTGA